MIWSVVQLYLISKVLVLVLLPIFLFLIYFSWVMLSMVIAKFFLVIVNRIHPPKEGYFPRDKTNLDYRFWTMRASIKKFPIWVARNFYLPWLDIAAFKLFGVKIKIGGTTALMDAWVDVEFIEIGKNVTIGQGAIILSAMVTQEFLIISKVTIGNEVVVGGYSVISPGTIIPDNVVIGAHSGTTVGQKLESNWVYWGIPARKFRKNEYGSVEDSEGEIARKTGRLKLNLTIDEVEKIERDEKRLKKRQEREEKKLVRDGKKIHKKVEKVEKKIERGELKRLKTEEKLVSLGQKAEEKERSKFSSRYMSKKMEAVEKKLEKRDKLLGKREEKLSQIENQASTPSDSENEESAGEESESEISDEKSDN